MGNYKRMSDEQKAQTICLSGEKCEQGILLDG